MPWRKKSLTRTLTTSLQRIEASAIQGSVELAKSFGLVAAQLDDPCFFQPNESDYVLVPVRMLTASNQVQNCMFNFAHLDGAPLKAAVEAGMFDDLLILKNHQMSVDNWLGKTQQTFWDASTPGAPPGVTGMMRLDKKSDPKVVRGILSGMLDSVSVTVGFDMEPSHPKMDEFDFFMNLGSEVDGVLVQCNVTKIKRLYELSVVWIGADQFAKVPGEDGIHTPGVSSNSQSFTEGLMDPKKLAALLAVLGLAPDTTVEALEAHLKAFQETSKSTLVTLAETQTKVAGLEAQVTAANNIAAAARLETATLQTTIEPFQVEIATLKPQAEVGLAHFTEQKAETLRIYALAVGAKKEDSMVKLINEAKDMDTLKGFLKTFSEQAESVAPLHCLKCHSLEIGRKASTDDGHGTSEPRQTTIGIFEQKRLEQTVAGMHRP